MKTLHKHVEDLRKWCREQFWNGILRIGQKTQREHLLTNKMNVTSVRTEVVARSENGERSIWMKFTISGIWTVSCYYYYWDEGRYEHLILRVETFGRIHEKASDKMNILNERDSFNGLHKWSLLMLNSWHLYNSIFIQRKHIYFQQQNWREKVNQD